MYLTHTIQNIILADSELTEKLTNSDLQSEVVLTGNQDNLRKIKSVLSIKNQWVEISKPIDCMIGYESTTDRIMVNRKHVTLPPLPNSEYIPYSLQTTSLVESLPQNTNP